MKLALRGAPAIVLACALLAGFAAVARLGALRKPLGREPRGEAIAAGAAAAAQFARRGFVESGGLPVVQPLPAKVGEGLEPCEPPLLSWATCGLARAAELEPARAARVAEAIFAFLAAAGTLFLGIPRFGRAGSFAAAAIVAIAPLSRELGGTPAWLGMTAAVWLGVAAEGLQRRAPLAPALAVAAGFLGSIGDYRFALAALVVAAAAAVVLGRGTRRPECVLALAAPLALAAGALAVVQRLAGGASLLWDSGRLWGGAPSLARIGDAVAGLEGGLGVPGLVLGSVGILIWIGVEGRRAAIPLALLAAAFLHAVDPSSGPLGSNHAAALALPCLALGTGAAIDRVARPWPNTSGLAVAALATALLVRVAPMEPPDAGLVETLRTVVRSRVAYGESFATNEGGRALLAIATERPALAGIDDSAKLETFLSRVDQSRFPCTWFVLVPFESQEKGAAESYGALLAALRGRFRMERDGRVLAFDLRPLPVASAPRESTSLVADFLHPDRVRLVFPQGAAALGWRVELGPRPLETACIVELNRADGDSVRVPPMLLRGERCHVRAIPATASRPAPILREAVVWTRSTQKLRTRTVWVLPWGALFLAVAAVLLGQAVPVRS